MRPAENRHQPKNKKKTLKRLLGYVTKEHKLKFALVLVCILISSVTGVAGSLFLEVLIDDYITPLLADPNPVFTGLLRAVLTMGFIYLLGILSTYLYTRDDGGTLPEYPAGDP